jgi:hypothetical protein
MNLADLERELAALRPVRPSPSLALGVARDLRRPAPRPARRLLAAAAALAAAVLLVVGVWPAGKLSGPKPTVARSGTDLPALAVYRHALDVSPDELERLLDRRALASAEAAPAPVTVPTSIHHLPD